jgi:anti-sigma regulatory factor (Ser/Thr protein kinase)
MSEPSSDLQAISRPSSRHDSRGGNRSAVRPLSRARAFPGRPEQLVGIRSFVKEVAVEARLDQETSFNLQLAVSEASANAIEHGLPRGDVKISAELGLHRLTITVAHPGCFRPRIGYDPSRRHRGMGVPLMLALTDEVVVSHPPGDGTTVSLSVWLK